VSGRLEQMSFNPEDKDIQQETSVLISVHLRSLILNLRWLPLLAQGMNWENLSILIMLKTIFLA